MKKLAFFVTGLIAGYLLAAATDYGMTAIADYNRTVIMQKEGLKTMIDLTPPVRITGSW